MALLHAICGIASLFSPIIRDTPAADLDPLNGATASFNSGILYRKFSNNDQGPRYFPRKLEDIVGEDESGFGGSHIRWASAAFRLAMQNGDRLIQLMQGWWKRMEGRRCLGSDPFRLPFGSRYHLRLVQPHVRSIRQRQS